MATNLYFLAASLKNYVVRPLNAFGLGGFVFDVEGESVVNLTAEITDHYLEDNSAVQDHIAVRPKKITLKGYVGELVYRPDGENIYDIQNVTRKLTIAADLLPTLTDAAAQAKEISEEGIEDISLDSINNVADYYAFAKNLSQPITAQEQAFLYFQALMNSKILMSVQTPFAFMPRMAIESVVAKQEEGTRFISDFTITLKEIRTAQSLTVAAEDSRYVVSDVEPEEFYQGRNRVQNQSEAVVGNIKGLEVGEGSPLAQSQAAIEKQKQRVKEFNERNGL